MDIHSTLHAILENAANQFLTNNPHTFYIWELNENFKSAASRQLVLNNGDTLSLTAAFTTVTDVTLRVKLRAVMYGKDNTAKRQKVAYGYLQQTDNGWVFTRSKNSAVKTSINAALALDALENW